MPEWGLILTSDIQKSWQELRPLDFALPGFLLLWLIILLLPLRGIDKRDQLTACMYALFCGMAGMMFIFVLPREFSPDPTLKAMSLTMITMMSLGFIRYVFRKNQLVRVRSDANGKSSPSKK